MPTDARAPAPVPAPAEIHAHARALAAAARERGAEAVRALGVGELCSFAKCFVLCSGRSDRNVRAIADALREAAKRCGLPVLGVEGYEAGHWVLLDLGDVVAHVFLPETRAHYDLDRLWGDAPQLLSEAEGAGDTDADTDNVDTGDTDADAANAADADNVATKPERA